MKSLHRLPEILAEHRRSSRGAMQQLADASGIERRSLDRYCSGVVEPLLSNAIRIASALNIPLTDLLARDQQSGPTVTNRQGGKRVAIPRPRSLPPLISLQRSAT